MSNIVLKGDAIQNIGEYLPNPYVEKINVIEDGSGIIRLDIDYSLMFMVSDEYDITDIGTNLSRLNLYGFATTSEQVLTKREAVDKFVENSTGSYTEEIGFGDIVQNLNNDDYDDNIYDSDDRQIIKATAAFSITGIRSSDIESGNLYLYMFSTLSSRGDMSRTGLGYLTTSNFAYEKVFSPNLRIVKEELPVYLTSDSSKYGQIPLLGLDRNYYQNRTVSREQIISKVRSLIARFDGSSNTALQENINNIKFVLSDKGESEDLLVELDKVRRGFTSKTNNNPVGNLYAAYSILLQNMNSSFPRTEMLTKQKYTTGKVFDLRTNNTGSVLVIEKLDPPEDGSNLPDDYITNPTLSRLVYGSGSFDAYEGAFFINFEKLVEDRAQFFDFTTPEKFYEIATATNLPSLKAALFSYFKAQQVTMEIVGTFQVRTSTGAAAGAAVIETLLDLTKSYGSEYTNLVTNQIKSRNETLTEVNYSFDNQQTNVMAYLYRSFGTPRPTDPELVEYDIEFHYMDRSYLLFEQFIDKYRYWQDQYNIYANQANQTCSYNNITNNFNNFFSKSVKVYWDDLGIEYPWEMMPTMYAIMSYLTTDTFDTFEEASEYARSVAHNISPDTGNLDFVLNRFKPIVEALNRDILTGLYSDLTSGDYAADLRSITKTHNITNAPADSVDVPSTNTGADSAEDAASTDSASTDPAEAAAVVASVIGGRFTQNASLNYGLDIDETTDPIRNN